MSAGSCPHCGRSVGPDGMCQVCGPVTPVLREPQPPVARRAGSDPPLPAEKPQPNAAANMMLGLLLLLFVGLGGLALVFFNRWSEEAQSPPEKPPTPKQRLIRFQEALSAGKLDQAARELKDLKRDVPASTAPPRLEALLAALKDGGDKVEQGYQAARWLESRKNFGLRRCGRIGREQLNARAKQQLEQAEQLLRDKQFDKAREAFARVPASSPHAARARRRSDEIRDRLATDVLAGAERALAEGKPLEADKLLMRGEGQIRKSRLAQLSALRARVVVALEAAARKAYAEGQGREALTYLHTRRLTPRFLPLYRQISELLHLVAAAQALAARGETEQAHAAWRKVLAAEPDAATPYHKLALQGLARK